MQTPSVVAAVRRELLAHPGVTEAPHRFGGVVFHLGGRELGHLHGERVADLPLPAEARAALLASGRIAPADVRPGSDWVSRSVDGPDDVERVVELFRLSLAHAAERLEREGPLEPPPPPQPASAGGERAGGWRSALAALSPRRRRRG